jgi:hypothetical protein
MTFALDLQKFAEKTGKKADECVGEIIAAVASELDLRSPVGDATFWKSKPPKGYVGGHFRANWKLGVGSIPTGVTPGANYHATLSGIVAEIPEHAAGKVYWLANNVPYAMVLEYGHSRQAPQGVVGLTAVKFQQIVRDAAESVQ